MRTLIDFNALQDQSVVWGVYLFAAFAILLAYIQLTRRWWFELRWLLCALMAVFLLVPAPVPGRSLYAPAMIMVLLSPFTGAPELIAAVIVRLLLIGVAALGFTVTLAIIRRMYLRRRSS